MGLLRAVRAEQIRPPARTSRVAAPLKKALKTIESEAPQVVKAFKDLLADIPKRKEAAVREMSAGNPMDQG
jgi:hypothetical protein